MWPFRQNNLNSKAILSRAKSLSSYSYQKLTKKVEWFQGLIGQSYKWVGPLLRAEILLDWQVNPVEPDASIGWLGSSILGNNAVWGVRRVKYVQVMIFTKGCDIQYRWYHRTDCSICYVPVGVAVETGMAVAALVEEDTCTLLGSCWR